MTGWRFPTAEDKDAEGENVVPDPLHDDFTHLRQIYFESDEDYSGRFTVPVLYDKKQKRIVSNESSEILRMFGTAVSSGVNIGLALPANPLFPFPSQLPNL